jgi:hypothetical protein
VEPRFAPRGIELRRFDAAERRRAQLLFRLRALVAGHVVHARKPLRRRAQDDGRLVPPAVHVAVRFIGFREQHATLGHQGDDFRIRLPDRKPAEVRQR